MNLEEANCCLFEKEYASYQELQSTNHEDESQLQKLGHHCLSKGVQSVIITLDERGCMVYSNKDGQFHEEFVPSIPVSNVIDTTGCGDSFAGGIAFGLMQEANNYILAAKYGNALGAQRTQGKTFDVFKSLEETNQMIRNNYSQV